MAGTVAIVAAMNVFDAVAGKDTTATIGDPHRVRAVCAAKGGAGSAVRLADLRAKRDGAHCRCRRRRCCCEDGVRACLDRIPRRRHVVLVDGNRLFVEQQLLHYGSHQSKVRPNHHRRRDDDVQRGLKKNRMTSAYINWSAVAAVR